MPPTRPPYPPEFRAEAVRLVRTSGKTQKGAHRRTNLGLTRRDSRRPVFPDRAQRAFAAAAPNRLWVADLARHPTYEGWLYLATVIDDAFSRRVVG